jgi:DNA-binding NarL/FixJ family response regulator
VKLLSTEPDITVVGEAADCFEAVMETRKLNPDVVLFDPGTDWANGLEMLRRITEEAPTIKLMVLTASAEENNLWQALNCGVQGYMIKSSTPEQLFNAIKDMMKGETVISPSLAGRAMRELVLSRERNYRQDGESELTARESEVLELLSKGFTDNEISSRLCIAVGTVRNHVHSVLRKLQLSNRVQLAIFAKSGKSGFQGKWGGGK